jgi:EAL domain-containing protein (putative c-di-GMP-specific phosphodiesterase class I)
VVNAATNEVSGFEALMRWNHPKRGRISPAVFIPIAEEANLIPALGEWTLRQACMDAAKWPGELRVAVNVSPIQFANENLPQIVVSALANSGLPPSGWSSRSPKACSWATVSRPMRGSPR